MSGQTNTATSMFTSSGDEEGKMRRLVARLNSEPGQLSNYDCPICRNKGIVYTAGEYLGRWQETARPCECMKIRLAIGRIKASGLGQIIDQCSFDRYEAREEWQQRAKKEAETYCTEILKRGGESWLFVGGAVGCGKTHLCTAVAREMLYAGRSVRYMQWTQDSAKLKAMITTGDYSTELVEYLAADVLYIDDFFKPVRDASGETMRPSPADIRLAYEIINHRYLDSSLITIISSERYASELVELDNATGSRIYERTAGHQININRDTPGRNYRISQQKII